MFNKASECLTRKLVNKNIIKKEEVEIYQFGIANFMMKAIHLISYTIIGFAFRQLPALIVFLAAFIPLRECSGGYHAKTPFRCYIISCITVASFLCLLLFLPQGSKYSILIGVFSSLILFPAVPVESENKPLSDAEKTYYKSKAGFIIIIELCLVFTFKMLGWNKLSYVLALSLVYELIIALAGLCSKIAVTKKS